MRTNFIKANAVVCAITIFINISSCSKSNNPTPGKSDNGTETPVDTTPTITSLNVTSGTFNTTVIIYGTNFSNTLADNKVYFNGKAATVTAATLTQLTVSVPKDAGTGTVTLSVKGGTTVTGPVFTYNQQAQAATITSIDINSGATGTVVKITGTGFSTILADDKVYFNGKAATVTAATTTLLTVTVPDGASTGAITLSVSGGATVTGPTFTYVAPAALKITSADVNKGIANAIVKITGTGFSTTLTDNKVFFNGKATIVTAATATQLTVNVPQDAGCGKITVTVNGTTVTGPDFNYYLSSTVTTLAGSNPGFADGTGSLALFSGIGSIAVDNSGNIYATDINNSAVRKITPSGTVSTVVGTGVPSTNVPGPINFIAADNSGNIYYSANGIHKIASGINVSLFSPIGTAKGLACDKNNNLYYTDGSRDLVVQLSSAGISTIIAGNGSAVAKDGTGTNAGFVSPSRIAIAASGNIYLIDGGSTIRKINTSGEVSTSIPGLDMSGIAVDKDENLYVTSANNDVIKFIDHKTGTISIIAGTLGATSIYRHNDGDQYTATFSGLGPIALDASGNIYIGDQNTIRKITLK